MEGKPEDRDQSNAPASTWGSTMDVASGSTSKSRSSPQLPPPPPRILDMQTSPEGTPFRASDGRGRIAETDVSSPVEQFSSPTKSFQPSELGSYPPEQNGSGSGSRSHPSNGSLAGRDEAVEPVQIPGWEPFPDTRGREAANVDIDPNGDDEAVQAKMEQYVALQREAKRKQMEREEPPSSIPSQLGAVELPLSQTPQVSTPPPAAKRQRRGYQATEPSSARPPATVNVSQYSLDPSDVVDPAAILEDPHSESSLQAATYYLKGSPLIPAFLKAEIERCVLKVGGEPQSQGGQSDSDTQEDGYLRTKSFWAFELARVGGNGVVSGAQLTSSVGDDEVTLVLCVLNSGSDCAFQLVEREQVMMTRRESRSNPWFDCNGHPFSVVYERSLHCKPASTDASLSVVTQESREQLSFSQAEREQLLEEKRLAIQAKEEAERRYQTASASLHSSQEHNDILQEQYRDASAKAVQWAKEAEQLGIKVEFLSARLTEGIKAVQNTYRTKVETLEKDLKHTRSQLQLLVRQNQLTNDGVREKAAKWDAYEAREKRRLEAVEKRRAEVDAERAAVYESLQEADHHRRLADQLLPHERFLQVDLSKQTEAIEDEEDELTMLKREAEEANDEVLDATAARSSRSRAPKRQASDNNVVDSDLALTMAHSQEQAQAAAADLLQGELDYQRAPLDDLIHGE